MHKSILLNSSHICIEVNVKDILLIHFIHLKFFLDLLCLLINSLRLYILYF